MRLERVFLYQVLRILRGALPVILLAFIAIPAWNYVTQKVRGTDSRAARRLPSGVSVHTEGFSYSRTEGGRTQFIVHAKQSVAYKDNKYMLEDVNVTVFGNTEQEPARNIRGKNCTYDQDTSDFECTGNVEIQLDHRTIVRTDQLIYNNRDGIASGPGHATLEQDGTIGQAGSMEYGVSTGLLKLFGGVNIQTPDHTEVQASTALFHQKENWTTMSDGVLIKSANGWIQGQNGRADLEPGTYRPKTITLDGNVSGETQPNGAPDRWKFQAGWFDAVISQGGAIERVKTRGNVQLEKSGEAKQRLTGDEMDTTFQDGKIDHLEARDNAQMLLGSDQTLAAPTIWTNAVGSIQTNGKSTLTVGDSTIDGRDFVIENGKDVVTFTTSHPATLTKARDQVSSSDQTRARFNSQTNMLIELIQSGNFQFQDPERRGRAQTARFEDEGTIITLTGSALVTDAQTRLEAPEIRLNQKNNSFVATKNVTSVMKNPQEQLLIKASRAEGGAESVVYTGNVQLWRGDAYVKADRLTAVGQERQTSRVRAEALPGNRVQSILQNVRATSETLDYDGTLGYIRYTGHVVAQKQDMILNTPDMVVNLQDNNVTEIVAAGGVTITRADQRGKGERAVYDVMSDIVTLTGDPAEVQDKEGLSRGTVLTIRKKQESVSVESQAGQPTLTRRRITNEKR
jgi:LPS export ABC transporter protein LptC/lipopolysaccharide transport protein LptA